MITLCRITILLNTLKKLPAASAAEKITVHLENVKEH